MTQFTLPSATVAVPIVIPRKAFSAYVTSSLCRPTQLHVRVKVTSDCNLREAWPEFVGVECCVWLLLATVKRH